MTTIGTLNWAQATKGNLSFNERMQLISPMLAITVQYAIGRLRIALGKRAKHTLPFDVNTFKLPDTTLAKHAEEACHQMLSETVINHSYRTFMFAMALAHVDNVKPDIEHLYVTSLLHDIALENPQPHHCFAVRGADITADIARKADCDEATTHLLAEAVAMHMTSGVNYKSNVLATLVANGALVDLVGLRLWDVPKYFVKDVLGRYRRADLKRHLTRIWKAEARAVPKGRAAWAEQMALFTMFIRLAPYKD